MDGAGWREYASRYGVQALLAGFTLIGLGCKLAISLNRDLDSDTVNAGIMAMEIWRHSNYLLRDFFVPANCSHIFSELVPFYLVPGILSGFSPSAYRLVGFAVFVLIVALFSCVVFAVTGSRAGALAMAALTANMSPLPFAEYYGPMLHNGVVVFIGLLFLLLLSRRVGFYAKAALFIATTGLLVFSDTMAVVWFFVPLAAYYVVLYGEKSRRSNAAMALACGVVAAALAAKMLLVDYYVIASTHILPAATIIGVNVPLYLEGLLLLYNGGLYQAAVGLSGWSALDVAAIAVTLLLAGLVFRHHPRRLGGGMRMVYAVSFSSAAIMMAAYVVTDYCQGIDTTRYLIFTGLLFFMVIAVSFREKSRLFACTLLALLAILALENGAYVAALGWQPNASEYGMIGLLEANGLSYGYGDYWTANVITYLSGEAVSIRQVNFDDNAKLNDSGHIIPYMWFSNASWYTYRPDGYFIVIEREKPAQETFIAGYLRTHAAERTLQYGEYDVYVFGSAPDVLVREPKSHVSLALAMLDGLLHGGQASVSMY